MSLQLYDEAVLEKFKKWSSDTNLNIIKGDDTSLLMSIMADKGNDAALKLPIIALRRVGGYTIQVSERTPLSSYGLNYEASEEKSLFLNAIPIHIAYQVDVYAKYLAEADEYMRNLVFNIINYPRLTIEIPYYEKHIIHDSSIHLDADILDNSAVPERFIPGEFSRLTAKFSINDAYLWDLRIKDNYKISEIDVEPYDGKIIN